MSINTIKDLLKIGKDIKIKILNENAELVAKEIFRQLGGQKFKVMTGAYNFLYEDEKNGIISLRFSFKGSKKSNMLKIEYNRYKDYYKMIFYKNGKIMQEYDSIYNDQLQELFTEFTGLYTTLF